MEGAAASAASALFDATMHDSMDMDIDIDLGDSIVEPVLDSMASPHATQHQGPQMPLDTTAGDPVPEKIFVTGCASDLLSTEHLTLFTTAYFPPHRPRVEWIDDDSATLLFDSPEMAEEALAALAAPLNGGVSLPYIGGINRLQLRAAKPLSSHPNTHLKIRIAVSTDRKRPRAYEASRYYMMNPERDPRERRRGDRNRRRKYDNEEPRRRRRSEEQTLFTASMYDDDEKALAERSRRNSRSSISSGPEANRDRGDRGDRYRPLRSDRRRSRDRSASPTIRGDDPVKNRRRRTPPPANVGKELFGNQDNGPELRGGAKANKELFPNKSAAASLKKELFPLKSGQSAHRSTTAFGATGETADLFATSMAVPTVDGAGDGFPLRSDSLQQSGFSIRGATKVTGQGLSIRGSAAASSNPVKELFPVRAGNTGKELFGTGNEGKDLFSRTTRRKKATDLFS